MWAGVSPFPVRGEPHSPRGALTPADAWAHLGADVCGASPAFLFSAGQARSVAAAAQAPVGRVKLERDELGQVHLDAELIRLRARVAQEAVLVQLLRDLRPPAAALIYGCGRGRSRRRQRCGSQHERRTPRADLAGYHVGIVVTVQDGPSRLCACAGGRAAREKHRCNVKPSRARATCVAAAVNDSGLLSGRDCVTLAPAPLRV